MAPRLYGNKGTLIFAYVLWAAEVVLVSLGISLTFGLGHFIPGTTSDLKHGLIGAAFITAPGILIPVIDSYSRLLVIIALIYNDGLLIFGFASHALGLNQNAMYLTVLGALAQGLMLIALIVIGVIRTLEFFGRRQGFD